MVLCGWQLAAGMSAHHVHSVDRGDVPREQEITRSHVLSQNDAGVVVPWERTPARTLARG
jgi:hypothetical protein